MSLRTSANLLSSLPRKAKFLLQTMKGDLLDGSWRSLGFLSLPFSLRAAQPGEGGNIFTVYGAECPLLGGECVGLPLSCGQR